MLSSILEDLTEDKVSETSEVEVNDLKNSGEQGQRATLSASLPILYCVSVVSEKLPARFVTPGNAFKAFFLQSFFAFQACAGQILAWQIQ